ncbi:hypothetical protein ABD87_14760 [Lysinibacillus sphaericus]|uniref:hypothetical protein n=1 Tax=Lysinibacillus sphaericus TaxID=1421 RepID=UPI0018CE1F4E|nr:hypothetical protein [Lysinibacillus sphaericus]MBG9730760.1 hypothetical protein [Lysinibacillus sphaericus]
MKKVLGVIVVCIAGFFLIALAGSVILDQFPGLQPMWEEAKTVIGELYQSSLARYGTGFTLIIILAIFILIGTSK